MGAFFGLDFSISHQHCIEIYGLQYGYGSKLPVLSQPIFLMVMASYARGHNSPSEVIEMNTDNEVEIVEK
jgi:hypothetical protein